MAYRLGEVRHLKEALRGRDARITALEDSLRAYELEEGGERTAQETVRQAEGEGGGGGCGCWVLGAICRLLGMAGLLLTAA